MRLIDEEHTRRPFYGSRKIMLWLQEQGRERVRRLMHLLGLQAVYPKPRLSVEHGHHLHPHGGRVRVPGGDHGLVQPLRAELGRVVEHGSGLLPEALERALHRGRPEIFNSDQGSQFTCDKFTGELARRGVAISMDGRGRCLDNIVIERLWRSLKYEEVCLRDYTCVPEVVCLQVPRRGVSPFM
jgi:putative transposase